MRIGIQRTVTPLLLAGCLLLLGCGSSGQASVSSSAPSSVSATSLDGRTFLSTEVTGQTLVDGTRITLSFEGGNVTAVAGCNTMTGSYTVEGGKLVVAKLGQTLMACEEPLSKQDAWLATLLTGSPTITLAADVLTLSSGSTTVLFDDRTALATANPLDGGAWTMASLETGGVTTTAPSGAYLAYDGGKVYVATGCNRGITSVEITGDTVTFSPMALTQMACEGNVMTWEHAVTTFLAGELQYKLDGNTLTLTKGDSSLVLHPIS